MQGQNILFYRKTRDRDYGKVEKYKECCEERESRVNRREDEKRELLRKVMPNVDALEDRFRAMGLSGTWT